VATSPAPSRRRGTTSGSSSRRRTLLYVGAGALLLVGVYLYLHRSSSTPALDSSGTPGPDQTGSDSGAQQPNGGAAGIPDNLPVSLISSPDTLQQQVQQNDTTSNESPQAIAPQRPGDIQPSTPPQWAAVTSTPAGNQTQPSITPTSGNARVPGLQE